MEYRYFLNMPNLEAVKANYKVLAKQLHPDTSTGNHEKFTVMKNEYDHILEVNPPFPIVNIPILNGNSIYNHNAKYPYTPEESISNLSPEELNRMKAEAFFARVRDMYFETIDNIIGDYKEKKNNKFWCFAQLNKLDDLSINHFKYMCYLLGMQQNMASVWYNNYIDNKVGFIPNVK